MSAHRRAVAKRGADATIDDAARFGSRLRAAAAWACVTVAGCTGVLGEGGAAAPARQPVLVTAHFAFFDDFDTNLNDALISSGLAHGKGKPELFRAGDAADMACFAGRPLAERAAWEAAVGFYAQAISPGEWNAKEQFAIRMQLAGFAAEAQAAGAGDLVELAQTLRAAAAPMYRACRWPEQEARNRRFIDDLRPRLAAEEAEIGARLETLYGRSWKRTPILVDVVETVNWSGANTGWADDGQGDILIANLPAGAGGLETLFHEASHLLMDRDDPLPRALDTAARSAGVRLPHDLWHVVLFYTTGATVREILTGRGEPYPTPMLYGIFARGAWTEYREPLERCWQPYVAGRGALADAAKCLIAALPTPSTAPR